jgi:multidrug efflux pump subunit AcrA (membrane-fusion protein)
LSITSAENLKATLQLPGIDETFEARLLTTSNSVSQQSRTALVQLLADNPDGKLWPGAFTMVHFHIPSDPNVLRIPATALIFGPHGMQVAKVGEENKVVLSKVQLGRNLKLCRGRIRSVPFGPAYRQPSGNDRAGRYGADCQRA